VWAERTESGAVRRSLSFNSCFVGDKDSTEIRLRRGPTNTQGRFFVIFLPYRMSEKLKVVWFFGGFFVSFFVV
jgi:hypothetical protein